MFFKQSRLQFIYTSYKAPYIPLVGLIGVINVICYFFNSI